jgi:phage tail sheath protein FI
VTDLPTNIPPGGHIAGVYARTDNAKSVGKAPAGTEDGRLLFATGIETRVEWADIDILHPNQINSIVNTPQTGLCVWGCRTLERPPNDFRYVHVRRLFNFLKASIFNSTHGFVFENVGAPLWSRIRMSVESFLLVLFQQGLFAGNTPSDAYLVICDETNNPKAVQDQGFVITDIYVAPNTPGEFIVFRIQQKVAKAA